MSRLLYNLHTYTFSVAQLGPINTVYHKVLRRIVGDVLFEKPQNSDHDVRLQLSCWSIEALLRHRRLMYFKRVVNYGRPLLLSALSTQIGGKQTPWTTQCVVDLKFLMATSNIMILRFADPFKDPAIFQSQLCDPGRGSDWRAACDQTLHIHSAFDCKQSHSGGVFVCKACPGCPGFVSSKALQAHMRTKHGARNEIRRFIGRTSSCPSCNVNFLQRFRLIAHLSDPRRTKCAEFVKRIWHVIPSEALTKLDEEAAEERSQAKRCGHSRPIASGSATRSNGKVIGCAMG